MDFKPIRILKSKQCSFQPYPEFFKKLKSRKNCWLNQCIWRHQKSELKVSAKISPPCPQYPAHFGMQEIEEIQRYQSRPSLTKNIALSHSNKPANDAQ
ncbi:hypothetical protein Y032_0004g1848 [Ancylostoma ceylanicum]|uniref:Uncharacterized protein n=1 Tax=Ancylostoma ceylanicum TaxID=53326 RepID=A0A016VVY1_9BILA|nr:hypothetical protein Y032_0004g1848 [Ancylostoma ceylanicum]